MRTLLLIPILCLCSCQQTGNAPKLQSHLQGATTSSQQTGQHVASAKNSVERADYKAGRALKVLDEGFSK